MEKIYITIDNETIEATGDLLTEVLENQKEIQEISLKRKTEAEAKAQAKVAAQAKLAALGLTVEDLQALGL